MIDPHSWAAHSLSIATPIADAELEQRLGLYRVFLKLYDHHRDLLNEILELENVGRSYPHQVARQYVQAVVQESQTFLVTNLIGGQTQALVQPQQAWLIGRDRTAALCIPDERLSRRHAVLQHVPHEGFYLFDLNSTNGSFVNGERVRQVAPLQEGDRIRLGSLTFNFFVCQAYQEVGLLSPQVLEQLNHIRVSQATPTPHPPNPDSIPWPPLEENPAPLPAEARDTSAFFQTPLPSNCLHPDTPTPRLNAAPPAELMSTVLHASPLIGECN